MMPLTLKIKELDHNHLEGYLNFILDNLKERIELGIISDDLKEIYERTKKELEGKKIDVIPYIKRYNHLMEISEIVMEYTQKNKIQNKDDEF